MKTVTLVFHNVVQSLLCRDYAEAQKAYRTIADALSEYRQFTNDKLHTASVSDGRGGETIIRLEHLVSASLSAEGDGDLQEEWAREQGRLTAIREVAKQNGLVAVTD